MADGPFRDTDAVAFEARQKAAKAPRLPALVIQGSADNSVAPINAVFLVRQFLLFNGIDELPAGAALPPAHIAAFPPRVSGYLASDYYSGRRRTARLVTIPGLAHAWSGGDAAYEFFDERHLDATALICDFFASHRK
jgi:poly(3-hydroxybutyrate) depolymerase